jgi:hypothetical protein
MLRTHWKLDKKTVGTLWEHIGNKKNLTPPPSLKRKKGAQVFFFLLTQIITPKKVKNFKIFFCKRTEFCEGK